MLKPLGYTFFPRWMMERSIFLYLALLVVVALLFNAHTMAWYFLLFGLVEVLGFFFVANYLTKEWREDAVSNTGFRRRLFLTSLTIRILYVLFSYWFYIEMTGSPFEFHAAYSIFYHTESQVGAKILRDYDFLSFWSRFYAYLGTDISDVGYAAYLSIVYYLTGNSILFCRIIKALLSAYTVILIYKISERNFGENIARISAVFCMLMPNLIYYCGLHLKETECRIEMILPHILLNKYFGESCKRY